MKNLFIFPAILLFASPVYSQSTFGNQSPAIRGDHNTVIYGVLDVKSAINNFNPAVISSLANSENLNTFSVALQEPGLARHFIKAIKMAGYSQILEKFLDAGLDPNLLVFNPEGKKESILTAAFFAQNADSMVSLLQRGAYSHGYQDILFDSSYFPFFVFPVHRVLSDDSFSRLEKERVVSAMVEQGVFLVSDENWKFGETTDRALKIVSGLREAPDLKNCGPDQPNLVCAVTEFTCPVTPHVPKDIIRKPDPWHDLEYDKMHWLRKLGSFGGKEYHVYLGPYGSRSYLIVAEFSADFYSAKLMKYQSPMGGMGICQAESDGYVNDNCWRSLNIEFDPSSQNVFNFGNPSYIAKFCDK